MYAGEEVTEEASVVLTMKSSPISLAPNGLGRDYNCVKLRLTFGAGKTSGSVQQTTQLTAAKDAGLNIQENSLHHRLWNMM